MKALAPVLKDSGILYNCQPRINLITQEMCEVMKQSNITLCIFGFESGNDRVLKWLKNDTSLTVEKSKKAVRLCRRNGLEVQGSMIMGSPTESVSELLNTLVLLLWMTFHSVQRIWVFTMTPFPATEMWKYLEGKEVPWSRLAHQEKPLLLSVNATVFSLLYRLAKLIENVFVIKKAVRLFTKHPLKMLKVRFKKGV